MSFFPNNNDVFRTQADPRFNSFAEPMNPVNQNPGNWGVDPNYLTPAYLSPFRPQYQGPTGDQYPSYNPKFGFAANTLFNPFASGGTNYGGNAMMQRNPMYDSVMNRPMDATASFTQNWVAPGIASWAAYKYLGKASAHIGGQMGEGLMAGMTAGRMAPGLASGLTAGGRLVGAGLGAMFLPMVAAQGAINGLDSAVFDPYIAQRKTGRSLRENYAGITFGEDNAQGVVNKGGLSRKYAAGLAKDISVSATKDMTFTQNETSMLTDYAARSGLMDNMNPSQMAHRYEQILKQVKTVMSIANTSDFKETIQIMAKLQMSGVGPTTMNTTMGALGAMAAAGGVNLQKAMNTTGTQGQYMFGAAGVTPYLGMQAGVRAEGSMAAAFRSGYISPTLMARMGGVEGAAQSAVAGQLSAYKTPYANMSAYNAYFNGGETGNVVSNLTNFGSRMTQGNPMENAGNYFMMGDALTSAHMRDRGLRGIQEQVHQIAQQIPGWDRKGKVPAGVAYMIMTRQMGMPHNEAIAQLQQMGAYQDEKTSNQMLAGNRRASIDAMMMYKQQEGLDKGIFTSPYNAVKGAMLSVQEAGAEAVGESNTIAGGLGDKLQNWWDTSVYRIKDSDKTPIYSKDLIDVGSSKTYQGFDLNSSMARRAEDMRGYQITGVLGEINKLAGSDNEDAKKFISSTGKERGEAYDALRKSKALKGVFNKADIMLGAALVPTTELSVPKEIKTLDIGIADSVRIEASSLGTNGSKVRQGLLKINSLAREGNKDAIKFIESKNAVDKQDAIWNLTQSKHLSKDFQKSELSSKISEEAGNLDTKSERLDPEKVKTIDNTLGAALNTVLKGGTIDQTLEYMNLMKEVRETHDRHESVSAETKQKIAKLLKEPGDMTDQRLGELSRDARINEISQGIGHIAGITKVGDLKGLVKTLDKKGMAVQMQKVEVGRDWDAALAQGDVQIGIHKEEARIRELRASGKIDANTEKASYNALDMGTAVAAFSEAVTRFSDSAGNKDKPKGPNEVKLLTDKANAAGRNLKN